MYDVFTLEVMEDFKATRRGGKITLQYIKGDTFQVKYSLDEFHNQMIREGKFKLLGSLLEDKTKR